MGLLMRNGIGYSGGEGESTFAGLDDVSLDNVQNGQVPKYNSQTQKWENADGGSSSANIVELTQEEYDALPDSKLTDGVMYAIKDVDSLSTLKSMNINGVFIDTDNIIVPNTPFRTSLSYTATQDCAISLYLVTVANATTFVKLNGKTILSFWKSSMDTPSVQPIYVKKGQTISIVDANTSYDSDYTVYGIQPASNVIVLHDYLSSCYSATERQIGCWVDGKPLYQKTFTFDPHITISNSSWESITEVSALNIENIIKCFGGETDDGSSQGSVMAWVDSGMLKCQSLRNNNSVYITHLTLQYTKTTDVAGSGNWTPVGTPTVHYSTEETCIGTWINGSPLYEKVYNIQARSSDISTSLLADLNIDIIVDCHIMVWDGSTYKRQELQYNSTTKLLSDIPSNKWISHISVQYTKA